MLQRQTGTVPELKAIQVEDPFWSEEMDLVRNTMLPYQWRTLNDQVPGAAPSGCLENFRTAASPNPTDGAFHGYVFQDSDVYKWIEAAAYSLAQHPDSDLEKTVDGAIALVCAAQQPDGYLDTYYIIHGLDGAFHNLRDHHELYCFGHLTEAAVAYWQATGKDALLQAARRYADKIDDYFRDPDGCQGYPGHEIAEMALFRLYEVTGCDRYKALAQRFLDRRGQRPYYYDQEHGKDPAGPEELRYQYQQAHLPVRDQTQAVGHAVRAMYLYSGMADSARLTGDTAMLAACRTLWKDVTRNKMYVTGGVGSTEGGEAFTFAHDLPNDTAYCETCASVGLVFFARRMLQLEVKSEYADVMERALYNGVLSGMSADGTRFFYVNPLEVRPDACKLDPHKEHVQPTRQPWFGCACCPPNLARLVESVGQYAWAFGEDTLYVHLHMGGIVQVPQCDGGTVQVRMTSRLPWSGEYRLTFEEDCRRPFAVAVRIPYWCGGAYTLEGAENANTWVRDGYLYLCNSWRKGDRIQFHFSLESQWIAANPAVWEDVGKVCLTRGPLVYCLEEADNGPDLHFLRVHPAAAREEELCDLLPGHTVPVITCSGTRIPSARSDAPLYAPYCRQSGKPATLRFIPYYLWANRSVGEMRVWVAAE